MAEYTVMIAGATGHVGFGYFKSFHGFPPPCYKLSQKSTNSVSVIRLSGSFNVACKILSMGKILINVFALL